MGRESAVGRGQAGGGEVGVQDVLDEAFAALAVQEYL
jgi:hypothetical protein